MSYNTIFDNAMETRISQVSTIRMRATAGAALSAALISSRGVASVPSNKLDRQFRVHKVFKFGMTGYGIPDYDQTNLLGGDQTKMGPWNRGRPNGPSWPDHELSPGLRTQSLELGMWSYLSSFPHFADDVIMQSDPTLVAEVLTEEMEAFGDNFGLTIGQSFYTSGNTDYAYVSGLTSSYVRVADFDGTLASGWSGSAMPDFSGEFTNTLSSEDCVLEIDISTLNQYAANKLEPGMAVDLIRTSDGDVLNEIYYDASGTPTATGIRAIGRVQAVSWTKGKIYVVFFAEADMVAGQAAEVSGDNYSKNQPVSLADFVVNMSVPGSWVECKLAPAYATRLSNNSTEKAMPLGINDFWKVTGQIAAGSGYQGGTGVGDGIIDVSVLPQFESYHENLSGAAVTPALFDRVAMRLAPQFDRFKKGATPDGCYTTYGVMQSYIENTRAVAQLHQRSDGSLDISKEGSVTRLKFNTTSGIPMELVADPFVDAGRIYIGKFGGGNWGIATPPSTGGETGGQPSTPSWLPFKFPAKGVGYATNAVPVQRIVNSTNRFTKDSYIPMELKMQVVCNDIPVGAIIANAKETTGYGSSTNLNA